MIWPNAGDLFPPATWSGPLDARTFPAAPYPGIRPEGSFVVDRSQVVGLDPSVDGWTNRETGKSLSLDGLSLVLAYGSNGNPEKLAEKLGTVIAIRCAVRDHAAVWCNARRAEGSVVATIAADPGRIETHHVLAVTEEQLDLIDGWEGHPRYYARQTMPRGSVLLESGNTPQEVLAYVGTMGKRQPLRAGGRLWRTADHTQDEVDHLVD